MSQEQLGQITESARRLLQTIPPDVIVVAAAKSRTAGQVAAVVRAGIRHIGHNYVQEAQAMRAAFRSPDGEPVLWHMIGHLQRNKAAQAADLFDMVETVDSLRLATALDRCCAEHQKVMPVLIEVNSGGEANKSGVLPHEVETLARQIAALEHVQVQGLMTMGPAVDDPQDLCPCFRLTKTIFDRLSQVEGMTMRYLSMGMSDSYLIAIEEGANLVRIGTRLFGPR